MSKFIDVFNEMYNEVENDGEYFKYKEDAIRKSVTNAEYGKLLSMDTDLKSPNSSFEVDSSNVRLGIADGNEINPIDNDGTTMNYAEIEGVIMDYTELIDNEMFEQLMEDLMLEVKFNYNDFDGSVEVSDLSFSVDVPEGTETIEEILESPAVMDYLEEMGYDLKDFTADLMAFEYKVNQELENLNELTVQLQDYDAYQEVGKNLVNGENFDTSLTYDDTGITDRVHNEEYEIMAKIDYLTDNDFSDKDISKALEPHKKYLQDNNIELPNVTEQKKERSL